MGPANPSIEQIYAKNAPGESLRRSTLKSYAKSMVLRRRRRFLEERAAKMHENGPAGPGAPGA